MDQGAGKPIVPPHHVHTPVQTPLQMAIAQQQDGHPNVILRSVAGGEISANVPNGTLLHITEERGEHVHVQVGQGTSGWAKSGNFQGRRPAQMAVAKQAEGHPEVFLRSVAGGDVVAAVPNGTKLYLLEQTAENVHVQVDGQGLSGWAKLGNVQTLSSAVGPPMVELFADFSDPKCLLDYCRSTHVRWLKIEYLAALASVSNGKEYAIPYSKQETERLTTLTDKLHSSGLRTGSSFPRCQDILACAPEAFASDAELADWVVPDPESGPRLLSVSHPWSDAGEPDLQGCQLAQIASFCLDDRTKSERTRTTAGCRTLRALFFDFASLPQQPNRTAEETKYFRRALEHMHLLYTHDSTMVLRLDDDSLTLHAPNPTPYARRGWCVFERRVAHLSKAKSFSSVESRPAYEVKESRDAFELWGAFFGSERKRTWTKGTPRLVFEEAPLVHPNDFKEELKSLEFAAAGTDRDLVGRLYEKVFIGRVDKD